MPRLGALPPPPFGRLPRDIFEQKKKEAGFLLFPNIPAGGPDKPNRASFGVVNRRVWWAIRARSHRRRTRDQYADTPITRNFLPESGGSGRIASSNPRAEGLDTVDEIPGGAHKQSPTLGERQCSTISAFRAFF